MFLRRCVRRKSGKRHTYWALVESYRTGRGSRQRVVAYLGELKRGEHSGWAQLGRKLSGQDRPRRSLFDPPHYDDPADDDEPVLVRLKGVAMERLRDFGDVRLAWGLWRLLELDRLLEDVMPRPGGSPLAHGGGDSQRGPFLQAAERVAHRGHVVSANGLGGFVGRAWREGAHRPLVCRPGRVIALQGSAGKTLARAAGRSVRVGIRPAAVRRDQHVFRGHVCGQSAGAARLLARRQAAMPASVHRPGGHRGGVSPGLRGLSGQPQRRQNRAGHRAGDGEEIRPGALHLGDGSRHGERGEPGVSALTPGAVHCGHAQGHAPPLRGTSAGEGLAGGARGSGGQAGPRAGRHRDVRPGAAPIAARRKRRCTTASSIAWRRRCCGCRPRRTAAG